MTRSNVDETTSEAQDRPDASRFDAPRSEAPQRRAPETETAEEVPPVPRKRVFVIAVLVVAGLLGYGGFKHWQTHERATTAQQEQLDFVPQVRTITAKADSAPIKLTLPGQTEPFFTATIYPRATGYVAERLVDIGSRVKKGDLLIRIAAPDLDAQLSQAKGQLAQTVAAQTQAQASLDQAKANLALASVTFDRTNAMAKKGYETVQNNDNQRTQVQAQQANVEAAQAGIKVASANTQASQATVERLTAMVSFEKVFAPFDGIITTRGVEKGDLVNADTKTGSPLFTVASDKVLRVTVHVPQANAYGIHDGLVGTAFLPQKPEQTFSGHIARSSVALLNSARTLDTEVDVDNPTGALKPGAYVNVSFDIPRIRPNVVLPAETLIFNQDGLHVARVENDKVQMRKIAIYRDFGKTFEIRDGVDPGDQVIVSPPPDLRENDPVKIEAKKPEEQAKK